MSGKIILILLFVILLCLFIFAGELLDILGWSFIKQSVKSREDWMVTMEFE